MITRFLVVMCKMGVSLTGQVSCLILGVETPNAASLAPIFPSLKYSHASQAKDTHISFDPILDSQPPSDAFLHG